MAPRVDHRRARAGALAEQVDPLVAHGHARGLDVVGPLGQRVPGEVDAVGLQARGAVPEAVGVRALRLRGEEAGRVLERRHDLRAVEPHGAVDAAVAEQHDVVVAGDPARLRELHVGDAGPALEPEDGSSRVRRARPDPGDRQRDQPRPGIGATLRHDERAAVGGVAAVLGRVVTRLQDDLAGVCRTSARRPGRRRCRSGGSRDRARAARSRTRPTMRPMVRAGFDVEVFTGFLSLPDGDTSTLGRRPSGAIVGRPRRPPVPADDFDSYSGRRQLTQPCSTFVA